jgi:transposase
MSDVNIYEQLLDLPDLKVEDVKVTAARIDVYASLVPKPIRCPICQATLTRIHQHTQRTVRDLNMGKREL